MKIVQCVPKTLDQITIAHISDLHWRSDAHSGEILRPLATEIANANTDIITVTGDVVDNPFSDFFRKSVISDETHASKWGAHFKHRSWAQNLKETQTSVLAFLIGLCKVASISPECLFVVPGNHDFRVKGLFSKRVAKETFREVFANHFVDRLIQIDGDRLFRLAVLCFDSNCIDPYVNFATGRIDEEELNRLRRLAIQDSDFKDAYKLALMHHHPLPVPEMEGKFIEGDQFHLLKNAGTVMREFVASHVNLVLHGHKHFGAYSHISFPLTQEGTDRQDRHELCIVGAGSVGKEREGYNFNIIRLYRDNRIRIHQKRRYNGPYESKHSFWLLDYERVRYQRYLHNWRKLNEHLHDHARKLTYSVQITDSGDAIERREYLGLHALGKNTKMRHIIYTESGYLGEDESPNCFIENPYYREANWKRSSTTQDDDLQMHIVGSIVFEPPLTKDHPVDLIVTTVLTNAFEFVRENRKAITDGKESTEHCHFTDKHHLLDHLSLLVIFPPEHKIEGKSIRVRAYDENGREDALEDEYIFLNKEVVEEKGVISLSIRYPLPGFKYAIEWDLPSRDIYDQERFRAVSDEEMRNAEKCRERLLHNDMKPKISQLLFHFRDELCQQQAFRGCQDDLELSFMAFDRSKMKLVVVGATYSQNDPGWGVQLHHGVGIAGQAFRRSTPVFYAKHYKSDCRYYIRVKGQRAVHQVLCSIPIGYLEGVAMEHQKLLGVFNIGSYSEDSALLPVAFPSTEQYEAYRKALVDCVMGAPFTRALIKLMERSNNSTFGELTYQG